MADTNNIDYIITNWDAAERQLTVRYDDTYDRTIRLEYPLPTTEEELRNTIVVNGDPSWVYVAKSDDTDISFIDDMIGVEYTDKRFDIKDQEIAVSEEEQALMDAAEKKKVEAVIEEWMANNA